MSCSELSTIAGTYRGMFERQIRHPTPENNSIILFNSKLMSRVNSFHFVHMVVAGFGTYGFKHFFGERVEGIFERVFKRANQGAVIGLYFFLFFGMQYQVNRIPYININKLANVHDPQSEALVGIVARYFPQKLYAERYNSMMRQR